MITAPPSGGPLPSSWTNAVTTAVNGLTTPAGATGFTTTTPAGTGWYRAVPGGMDQFHWVSTGTIASGGVVTPDFPLPVGHRPAAITALSAVGGLSGLAAASVSPDGTWSARNGHTTAIAVTVDGLFMAA